MKNNRSIGIFDSGVGGLSVYKVMRSQLPAESILYFADQNHVPYGLRPMEEVRKFSEGITRFLLERKAKLIVVACNAASAAALHYLREKFPSVYFVGMEPAVKPAAETTHTGVVGVLATPATFQGALYASVVERFASNVTILQNTCPGLVQQIEHGELDTPKTRLILETALRPMVEQGIDTIVLGCTHYPFVIPLIQEIAGPNVRVIDPAPAVVRQVSRLLKLVEALPESPAEEIDRTGRRSRFFTSGDAEAFKMLIPKLAGEAGEVEGVVWIGMAVGVE